MPIYFPWTNARQCVGLALWDFMTGLVALKKGVEVLESREGWKKGTSPVGVKDWNQNPLCTNWSLMEEVNDPELR